MFCKLFNVLFDLGGSEVKLVELAEMSKKTKRKFIYLKNYFRISTLGGYLMTLNYLMI